jgi:hypothetical protein
LTVSDVTAIDPRLNASNCMRSMHVVSRSGRITIGFDAVRSIAAALPLFWPLAAIAFVPGVAWAGRCVYNWYAAIRPRDVSCADEVCGIHAPKPPVAPRERGKPQYHRGAIATRVDNEEVPHS